MYIKEILVNFIYYCTFYSMVAGSLYIIFWVLYAQKLSNLRIQIKRISTIKYIKHDFLYSLQSIAISSILITFLFAAYSKDKTQIYSSSSSYPYLYTIISVFIVLFIDDTFFYWSHRLMHHPKLFNYTHKAHHYSIDPSPFTSLAFQPIETLLENFVGIILPFILPIHWNVILIWQFISFTNNFIAHLGYEVYTAFWIKLPFLKLKTTSTHHNMHHRYFNGNYAFYFTWWDRLMGTEIKEYESSFLDVHKRN